MSTEERTLTQEERIARGEEAKRLLDHPLMKAYLEHYGEWSFDQFKKIDLLGRPQQEVADELIWLRMLDQAQQNFTQHFFRFVLDGQQADAELRMKRNPTEPLRSIKSYGNPRS